MRRLLRGAGVALLALAAALFLLRERPSGTTGRWLQRAGLEARFERVDGLRLRYVRSGTGSPLVLLHGLGSSIYSWSEVLPELARDHDVLALDLPGFGVSDQPAELGVERLPGAVLGLLDRLGIARASLAGNSLGGAVAVLVAARAPERVEKLVLIDSAGFNLAEPDRPALLRLVGSLPAFVLEALPLRRTLTRLGLRQVFFDPRRVSEERVEEYAAPLLRPGAVRALLALLRAPGLDSAAFTAELAKVRAPTLILWGREDRWIPVAQADRFAEALPGSRTIVLAGCGHVPQEERPAETAALIRSFLRR